MSNLDHKKTSRERESPRVSYPQIRSAVSILFILCLGLYILMARSFDKISLTLVVLAAVPWLALLFQEINIFGLVGLKSQVQQNSEDIITIAMLMKYVLTRDQLKWLFQFTNGIPTVVNTNPGPLYDGFKNDLLHLRGLGFIKNKGDRYGFAELESAPRGLRDALEYFVSTKEGEDFLRHLLSISKEKAADLIR